jgi:TldD protein
VNEQKYFASDRWFIHRPGYSPSFPSFTVTKIDSASNSFQTRSSLSSPVGMGYEYLTPMASETIGGITPRYKKRYDMLEDMKFATKQAAEKSPLNR